MTHETFTNEEMQRLRTITLHPQVHIEANGWKADVDEGLAPLILALWHEGIETLTSCVGTWPEDPLVQKWYRHIGRSEAEPGPVSIEFAHHEDLLWFLTLAARQYERDPESIYNRICRNRVSETAPWEIGISPPIDLNIPQARSCDHLHDSKPDLIVGSWSVRFPHHDLEEVLKRVEGRDGKTRR
jgi:hypothetical protein